MGKVRNIKTDVSVWDWPVIPPTAESLITFCLLGSSTKCHKMSTASSAVLKQKQNIMSSLKLLFTSGLLCCSNSSGFFFFFFLVHSVFIAFFFFFFCWDGFVANGKYHCSPELQHWNITCLNLSSVFPNAYSGKDALFLTFLVEKLHRNGLFLDDSTIWVLCIFTPLHFQIFSTPVWQEGINHRHSLPPASHHHCADQPDQSTLPKNRR